MQMWMWDRQSGLQWLPDCWPRRKQTLMMPWEHLRSGENTEGETGHELQPFLLGKSKFPTEAILSEARAMAKPPGSYRAVSVAPVQDRLPGTGDRMRTVIWALQDQVLCGLSSSLLTTGHSDAAWQKRRRRQSQWDGGIGPQPWTLRVNWRAAVLPLHLEHTHCGLERGLV